MERIMPDQSDFNGVGQGNGVMQEYCIKLLRMGGSIAFSLFLNSLYRITTPIWYVLARM